MKDDREFIPLVYFKHIYDTKKLLMCGKAAQISFLSSWRNNFIKLLLKKDKVKVNKSQSPKVFLTLSIVYLWNVRPKHWYRSYCLLWYLQLWLIPPFSTSLNSFQMHLLLFMKEFRIWLFHLITSSAISNSAKNSKLTYPPFTSLTPIPLSSLMFILQHQWKKKIESSFIAL